MTSILGYIDPVSGSILLQLLIAGFVGIVGFFHRTIFGTIGRLFGRSPRADEARDS